MNDGVKFALLLVAISLLVGCVIADSHGGESVAGPTDVAPLAAPPPPAASPASLAPNFAPAPAPVIVAAPPAMTVAPREPSLAVEDIVSVYEDLLGRPASPEEIAEWRGLSEQRTLAREEVRRAVRETPEFRALSPETVVRQAYREYFHRPPDPDAVRNYRRLYLDRHWTAGQVRRAIAIEAIIDHAYDDLLERKPDEEGRAHYRDLLEHGASETDVRAKLRDSVEYRVTLPDAKTRRAYREVLGRDPDASGLESYRRKIVDKGWSEDDVKNDLRRSEEYRRKSSAQN